MDSTTLFKPKNRTLIILWLCLIGFLGALPIIHLVYSIGSSWDGVIPSYISDSLFYFTRISKTAENFPLAGNHYFLEHKGDLQPVFSMAETFIALPMKFGLSFNVALILSLILFNVFFAFILYKYLRKFCGFGWSLIFASIIYIQSYGMMVRPVIMETVLPFFILFHLSFLNWFLEPSRRRNQIFLAITVGLSFYIYSYLWQIVLANILIYGFWLLLNRKKAELIALLKTMALAILIALPVLIYSYSAISLPDYWENAKRIGLVITHLPSIEAYYYGRWLVLGILLWLVIRPSLDKNTSRTAFVTMVVGSLAILSVILSNIITGKDADIARHAGRFVAPWFTLVFLLGFYWVGKFKVWRNSLYKAAILAIIFILGIIALFSNLPRSLLPPFNTAGEEAIYVQSYKRPLEWLNHNTNEPKVILANNSISLYVPYLSKHYVLFPGLLNFHFYRMTDNEVRERYLISRSAYNKRLGPELIEEEYPYYAGAYYDYKNKDLGLRNKICMYFGISKSSFCEYDIATELEIEKRKNQESLMNLYNSEIKTDLQSYLEKYEISYVIKDREADVEFNLRLIDNSRLVYDDGRFMIYEL